MRTLPLVLLMVLAVAACSSQGDRRGKTNICTKKFLDDHKLKVEKTNKVDLEKDKSLNSGELNLSSVDIYIHDTDKDIRLHVRHSLNETREDKTQVLCIGGSGITQGMTSYHLNVPVIDKLILGGGKTIYGSTELQIELSDTENESLVKTALSSSDSTVDGSLKAIYSQFSDVEQFYFQGNEIHQLRNAMKKAIPAERNSSLKQLIVRTTQDFEPAAEEPAEPPTEE